MISPGLDRAKTVLCIGAHADDIEIGCGGTLLHLLRKHSDIDVRWVVLSGNQTRAAEAKAGAERVLASAASSTVQFGEFEDACFPYSEAMALKEYFRELSADCAPDLIFTHRREDLHQDHRFVAELTWQHFRNHLILEYEIPKYEGDLGHPSVFVPIEEELAAAKIEILFTAFASQCDKPWFTEETFRSLMRIRGIECQSPTGYAEAFACRKMMLD